MRPLDPFHHVLLSDRNKETKLGQLFRAPWIGIFSFIQSTTDRKKTPSVLYVLKKK